MGGLAPLLPAGYEQGTAMLQAILMLFAAQEYERGAEIRAAENRDMRALFQESAPLVADAALRTQLARASETSDASLAISTLNESNAALRRLLIALHEHVESCEGRAARDWEMRIWNVLRRSAERRLLKL